MELKDFKIVLASGSPRRSDMLRADGLDFTVIKPEGEEILKTELKPHQAVMALALRKNLEIFEKLKSMEEKPFGQAEDILVISADTVVVLEDEIIGKPLDEEDAFGILSRLRAKKHRVLSGACLTRMKDGHKELFYESTDVYFRDYDDEVIWNYIKSGEPMDKAGAYAIQGGFGAQVERTDGPMDNVIGMPYNRIKHIVNNW